MAEPSVKNRRRVLALCAIGLLAGGWFAMRIAQETRDPKDGVAVEPANGSNSTSSVAERSSEGRSHPPVSPPGLPPPDYRFGERGRLTVDAESLREGGVATFGLPLADDARGDEPLAARVVSLEGRVLDLEVTPVAGEGGGVQLEIEADWLQPGRYMIQIKTREKSALQLRRFVLEVK